MLLCDLSSTANQFIVLGRCRGAAFALAYDMQSSMTYSCYLRLHMCEGISFWYKARGHEGWHCSFFCFDGYNSCSVGL